MAVPQDPYQQQYQDPYQQQYHDPYQQQPYQAYGQPYGGGGYVAQESGGALGMIALLLAILGLVFAIIGWWIGVLWFVGLIFAILAIVFGYIAKTQFQPYGNAGMVLGIIALVVAFMLLIIQLVILAAFLSAI